MKTLIWIVIALVVIGGIAWFLSSDAAQSSDALEQQDNYDPLSENGRIIDTEDKVFEELDEAIAELA